MTIKIDGNGKITGDENGFQTGDFMFKQRASAPPGWIVGNGSTIGNVGSGATRANVDTLDLFTLWWTDYTDAQLPILTSTGAASTRGASAAADWAALKRLTVFDVQGRFVRAAGTINGVANVNGTKQSDAFQSHGHIVGIDNVGAGSNDYNVSSVVSAYSTGNTVRNSIIGTTSMTASSEITTTGGAPRTAAETRPANIAMLACYKL
jgi:hypothetical protein